MTSRISQYVSYNEAIASDTARSKKIDNNVTDKSILDAMSLVATKVFDPLRVWAGGPVGISSFYRSPKLNVAVGGSATSDHCKGRAIDIDADMYPATGKTNRDLFVHILDNLEFDQLIWEYAKHPSDPLKDCNWVHASYRSSGNRKQVLIKLSGQPYRVPTAAELKRIRQTMR